MQLYNDAIKTLEVDLKNPVSSKPTEPTEWAQRIEERSQALSGVIHDIFASIDNDSFVETQPAVDGTLAKLRFRRDATSALAQNDLYKTIKNTELQVQAAGGVLANDIQQYGSTLTVNVKKYPDHGTLIMQPDGSFNYIPDNDFSGSDSFTYSAKDNVSESAPATVAMNVVLLGDLKVDGKIDVDDVSLLTALITQGIYDLRADFDGDGVITVLDARKQVNACAKPRCAR